MIALSTSSRHPNSTFRSCSVRFDFAVMNNLMLNIAFAFVWFVVESWITDRQGLVNIPPEVSDRYLMHNLEYHFFLLVGLCMQGKSLILSLVSRTISFSRLAGFRDTSKCKFVSSLRCLQTLYINILMVLWQRILEWTWPAATWSK